MTVARWIVYTIMGAIGGGLAGAAYAFATTKRPEE